MKLISIFCVDHYFVRDGQGQLVFRTERYRYAGKKVILLQNGCLPCLLFKKVFVFSHRKMLIERKESFALKCHYFSHLLRVMCSGAIRANQTKNGMAKISIICLLCADNQEWESLGCVSVLLHSYWIKNNTELRILSSYHLPTKM